MEAEESGVYSGHAERACRPSTRGLCSAVTCAFAPVWVGQSMTHSCKHGHGRTQSLCVAPKGLMSCFSASRTFVGGMISVGSSTAPAGVFVLE